MLHKIWKKYKYKRTHSFNNIKMEKQQQKTQNGKEIKNKLTQQQKKRRKKKTAAAKG